MATVIAVEPNALLREGILRLVEKMAFEMTSEGIDYFQLFNSEPAQESVDLMLLSVPDVYDRMIELVAAAQRGYGPKRILLLSSVPTLNYSLLNLPPTVAGYVSKYSSHDVLTAAITMVMAGGKCFPVQDLSHSAGNNEGDQGSLEPGVTQRRRWYERQPSAPAGSANNDVQPANLLAPTSQKAHVPRLTVSNTRVTSAKPGEDALLSAALIDAEAKMLGLTRRQFEVLALLARGSTIKNISHELNISIATTKVHAQTLYQRLDVHNRNAAIHTAFLRGATLGWSSLDIERARR